MFFMNFLHISLWLKTFLSRCLTSLMSCNSFNWNPLTFSRIITIFILSISFYNSHFSSVGYWLLNNLLLIWLLRISTKLWHHSIFFNPVGIITRSCNLFLLELVLIKRWFYIFNNFLYFFRRILDITLFFFSNFIFILLFIILNWLLLVVNSFFLFSKILRRFYSFSFFKSPYLDFSFFFQFIFFSFNFYFFNLFFFLNNSNLF